MLALLLGVGAAGTVPAAGQPGSKAARPIDDACPQEVMSPHGFGDVEPGSTHERAITCVVHWSLTSGTGPGRYSPGSPTTRAQMATFVVRLLEAADLTLEPPSEDQFDDDNGSVHEFNINLLAAAGVVSGRSEGQYDPDAAVTRAQMATFLVRAVELVTGQILDRGPNAFDDDDGDTHEPRIDAAANAGLAAGVGDRRYDPGAPVRRDQMASFLARVLDLFVDGGYATVPGTEPVPVCEDGRVATDQPDDSDLHQVRLLYAVPADGEDRSYDTDGTIARSAAAWQTWFRDQTGGPAVRLDTCDGDLDIGFLRLPRTDAEYADESDGFIQEKIAEDLDAADPLEPHKLYLVYYDGTGPGFCGSAPWPPDVPGQVPGVYLRGEECESDVYGTSPTVPTTGDLGALHEVVHALGFVATCGTNASDDGHSTDDPRDLMYAGPEDWDPSILDPGQDDYWQHGIEGCADLSRSAFLDPQPIDPELPGGETTEPEPACEAGRVETDRRDDSDRYQVRVLYALPADGEDRSLDTDGTIARSTSAWDTWFRDQTGGPGIRLDTCDGDLDIGFHRLPRDDAEYAAEGDYLRDAIERDLVAAEQLEPHKIYVVYYDGTSTEGCASGPWPPSLVGQVAGLYLRGSECESDPIGESATVPGYVEYGAVHEVVHALGFAPTCGATSDGNGHTTDDPRDLMYAGPEDWVPSILDPGNDDYWEHGIEGCADLSSSAFLDPLPTDPELPEGWTET